MTASYGRKVGAVAAFMANDHDRIDRLLAASIQSNGSIDHAAYHAFRGGLLRHIAMEEKILLPFLRAKRAGVPFADAERLRADHGAIAKLLVRTPTAEIVRELRAVLGPHNVLEEGPLGLYAACDATARDADVGVLLEKLRGQPEVPQAAFYDGPLHRR